MDYKVYKGDMVLDDRSWVEFIGLDLSEIDVEGKGRDREDSLFSVILMK